MAIDANGSPVSFRAILLVVVIVGLLAITIQVMILTAAVGQHESKVGERIDVGRREAAAGALAHVAIEEKLNLMAVILTLKEQRDLDQIRSALIPQLSPALRAVFEEVQRTKDEREGTRRGIPRQPDESPDNTARERRRGGAR